MGGKQGHDGRGSLVINRRPQLNFTVGVIEPLGKNSNDYVGPSVEQNGSADERRISSITPLPQAPCQDYCCVGLAPIVAREQESSACRFDAKERKDVPCSHLAVHQLRQLAART